MNITIPMLSLERNGGNRVLIAIANRLIESGHECEIVTPRHHQAPGFVLDEAITVHEITPAFSLKPLKWLVFMLTCCWKLRNRSILANHFVTAISARVSAALSSARIVYLVQDIEYRFYPRPLSWIANLLCRFTYRITRIIPANPYLEQELKRIGINVMPAIRLGVASNFLNAAYHEREKIYDVVCFIRRGRHKRPDRLAAIADQLRQQGVTVVGITPEAGLLTKFEELLDAGFVPTSDKEIISILDRSRILLLTSEHEGFSLPPLEAMARGLPVVLFPCGGPSVYAKHEYNALVVSDQRTDTAITHIQTLLNNDEHYAKLSRNAITMAWRFSLDDAASEFIAHLEDLFRAAPTIDTKS